MNDRGRGVLRSFDRAEMLSCALEVDVVYSCFSPPFFIFTPLFLSRANNMCSLVPSASVDVVEERTNINPSLYTSVGPHVVNISWRLLQWPHWCTVSRQLRGFHAYARVLWFMWRRAIEEATFIPPFSHHLFHTFSGSSSYSALFLQHMVTFILVSCIVIFSALVECSVKIWVVRTAHVCKLEWNWICEDIIFYFYRCVFMLQVRTSKKVPGDIQLSQGGRREQVLCSSRRSRDEDHIGSVLG